MESARSVVERFWARMATGNFAAASDLLAADYVLDWPQSGERIRGPENFAAVNRAYPAAGPWRFAVRRIVGEGPWVVSEVAVTDGVTTGVAITFSEVEAGEIVRQIEYWPDPFEPAAWRERWVERA